jgi:hypothetical protein
MIHGPHWAEAIQILNVAARQVEAGVSSEIPPSALNKSGTIINRQAFTNKPRGGSESAAASLWKVLEAYKFSEKDKGKAITHVISPAFWKKVIELNPNPISVLRRRSLTKMFSLFLFLCSFEVLFE